VLGEGCVLLEGSVVGAGAVLEAGTVVPPGRLVPAGQVWGGKPARYVRDVSKDELVANAAAADRAAARAAAFADEELPAGGFVYRDAERVRKAAAEAKKA
jgi:carbonic anhydrase/acetyltransferase-like protein (isoleucine patch superfamily)